MAKVVLEAGTSPYQGLTPSQWKTMTQQLVAMHPLTIRELAEVTLHAWESIFTSSIGGFHIGVDIFPKPQTMGFFLHELVPLEFRSRYPSLWRGDITSQDKDMVYIADVAYSVEIKTSSDPRHIYGNRSYAQQGSGSSGKKEKNGYCLAVNFEAFTAKTKQPKIIKIRFGWLDHNDWSGQKAATGQQARLALEVEAGKLLEIYRL